MTKKELFVSKFCDEEGDYLNEYVPTDIVWSWIENEIRQAKIESKNDLIKIMDKVRIEENDFHKDMADYNSGWNDYYNVLKSAISIPELEKEKV